jgi:protein SCO1
MKELSRRKLLRGAAITPAAALLPGAANAATASFTPVTPGSARALIQRQHLPNVPLVTHEGEQVLFYDDLIKDKIVTLNFFYSSCNDICPTVTANLAAVQSLLGEQVGRQVFMYSFTLDPETDDVNTIKRYRAAFEAGPGWTFLTGKRDDLEKLRKAIGFRVPDPALDRDKEQHIGNIRYGNEPLMLWAACPGMAHASFIAKTISWMVKPDTSRVQPP